MEVMPCAFKQHNFRSINLSRDRTWHFQYILYLIGGKSCQPRVRKIKAHSLLYSLGQHGRGGMIAEAKPIIDNPLECLPEQCLHSTVYNNMKRSRSKRGRSHAPLFVSKLLQMVENPQLKEVISWNPQGDSFLIHSVARFTNEVLPRYFKHNNYSSFVRQLNMYGFHKGNHPEAQAYFHQNFRPGNKAKLRLVTRTKREEREEQQVAVIQNQVVSSESTKELQELRAKHKGLQEMCRHFFLQNQKLMQENTALLHKMKTDTINRNNRLESICSTLALPNPSLNQEQSQNDTPHLRRVRALLQQLYEGISSREQQHRHRREYQQAEDESYLSIHDFINAQDYEIGLDLEDSR